ncbi:ATP synthase F1 subunit gamma [Ileibacterium valens]|uniref:ATP synthase gamma chain n=1 Tax=Ileibacterium valens TaxID=1862668 RepID=A0A1U7NFM3_9FIRM|nr:ATP synthase F1 subunit gamma [Ileibacterium valens]OLU38936.1 ATP synthase F1 subunit gamma [Erysipelotrichaceae bacterium NYU-BL-E8]OLU39223.1 ATP synthase F1 subunit gamma [Ileibacterium valens]OLU42182.1 ATP synthase F1 subunit gamma [Erysipelotrichaceae bacterium NYU-BL-F16]
MPGSGQAIKSRIASVDSTKKITNAMQLVASAKLNKTKARMEANREYAESLHELLSMVLAAAEKGHQKMKEDPSKPSFVFVITSDMGLCGAYNANLYKKLLKDFRDTDYLVMIGSHGLSWAKARGIKVWESLIDLNEDDAYEKLASETDRAIKLLEEGKIGAIKVLYTHYKNTLTFEPTMETLLPPKEPEIQDDRKKMKAVTEFEPNQEEMLDQLIPMITKSVLYSRFMESKTSEQASRRMAMESATDNAEELLNKLNLEYNRARQSAITQEITEIVGGANALS